jgi:hypothetical protein
LQLAEVTRLVSKEWISETDGKLEALDGCVAGYDGSSGINDEMKQSMKRDHKG